MMGRSMHRDGTSNMQETRGCYPGSSERVQIRNRKSEVFKVMLMRANALQGGENAFKRRAHYPHVRVPHY